MPPRRPVAPVLFNGTVVARNPSFVLHADGYCLHASPRVAELLGCPPDTFISGWAQFLHPDGAMFRATLRTNGSRVAVYSFYRRLAGTSQYLRTTLRTLLDRDDQTVLGYVGSIRTLKVIPAREVVQQTA